jgi:hypothetical protein
LIGLCYFYPHAGYIVGQSAPFYEKSQGWPLENNGRRYKIKLKSIFINNILIYFSI